ncbi:hypothetical protein ACIBVL_41840 [Streptomyces sp. NPDC049687]
MSNWKRDTTDAQEGRAAHQRTPRELIVEAAIGVPDAAGEERG